MILFEQLFLPIFFETRLRKSNFLKEKSVQKRNQTPMKVFVFSSFRGNYFMFYTEKTVINCISMLKRCFDEERGSLALCNLHTFQNFDSPCKNARDDQDYQGENSDNDAQKNYDQHEFIHLECT